jgi:hypothetical protein
MCVQELKDLSCFWVFEMRGLESSLEWLGHGTGFQDLGYDAPLNSALGFSHQVSPNPESGFVDSAAPVSTCPSEGPAENMI